MPITARELGLEVGTLVDERRNPLKSTDAALRYLDRLYDEFGSWHLALAAYNSGPTRVRRILRRHAPDEPGSDLLYWRLREHFPRETAEFLPKLYGAMWVASRPESYGYGSPPVRLFTFDPVTVPDLTSLDVVALASGASLEEIVRLNPEYVRGVTPPGRDAGLRVPPGRGARFARIYPRLTPEQRVTAVRHVVQSGETLAGIAERYGIDRAHIDAVNPDVDPRGLRIGERLVVPVSPPVDGMPPLHDLADLQVNCFTAQDVRLAAV
jgi:membrane-bound lytic murein transglycosylase D